MEQISFIEEVPKQKYVRVVERILYSYPSYVAGLENELDELFPSATSSYEESIRGSDISKPTENYGIKRAEKELRVRQMNRALDALNQDERELVERKYFSSNPSDEQVMFDMQISNNRYYKLKDQALRKVATALNVI